MSSLEELFQQCKSEVANPIGAVQRFVLAAKKNDEDVIMSDVKNVSGFIPSITKNDGESDMDFQTRFAKEQQKLNTQWSTDVIKPVKEFLLHELYAGKTFEEVFIKPNDNNKAIRSEILDRFPRTTRNTKKVATPADFSHLKDIL